MTASPKPGIAKPALFGIAAFVLIAALAAAYWGGSSAAGDNPSEGASPTALGAADEAGSGSKALGVGGIPTPIQSAWDEEGADGERDLDADEPSASDNQENL